MHTKELVRLERVMGQPTPTMRAHTECIIGFNKLSIESKRTTGGFEGWKMFPEQDLKGFEKRP